MLYSFSACFIFSLTSIAGIAAFESKQANSGTWSIVSSTSATTVVGIGASGTFAAAGAASNGIGAFVELYNGVTWAKDPLNAGLLLDAVITADGKTIVAAGTLPIFVSQDGGNSFFKVSDLTGTSQSANVYGESKDKLALVGTFIPHGEKTGIAGVAFSADSGSSWELSSPIPGGYARYGAFPSDNVWYVSSGTWGNDPSSMGEEGEFRLSSRFHVRNGTVHEAPRKGSPHAKLSEDTPTGWFGAISKTTDGGKTWTQVFLSDLDNDYWYFNGIACSSETVCVAVAEGDTADGGYLTLTLSTFDGGSTWTQTFTSSEVSLMGAAYSAASGQLWILGSSLSGRQIEGQYRVSSDGGHTFDLVQSLGNCLGFDISFGSNDSGFSTCGSSSGSSAVVAVYSA